MTIFFYCKANIYPFFEDYINSLITNIEYKTKIYLYMNPIPKHLLPERKNNADDKHIFLQRIPHEAYDTIKKESIYLLSTEQLSIPSCFNYIRSTDDNVIDYSEENIRYYGNRKSVYHIPYQVNKHEIYEHKKVNDVAMVGNNSPRRWQVYNEILNKGIRINNISGWRQDRDKKLFNHKILVNVHYDEHYYKMMEQMRINRCIFNKIIVITENSIYQDALELKPYMLTCEFNKISEFAEKVVKNYSEYYNKIFDNFDIDKMRGKFLHKLDYFLEQ